MLVCFLGRCCRFPPFLFRRLYSGARICAVDVQAMLDASALRIPSVSLFRFFARFADLLVVLFSRFNLEVINFQSSYHDSLINFDVLPSSVRTLYFFGTRCGVVIGCLADCAPLSCRLRLVWLGCQCPMLLHGSFPSCFHVHFFVYGIYYE